MAWQTKQGGIYVIKGPMFSGKCEAAGTRILMYDGTIREIENITEGDLLMGDDSTPRKVLSTSSGEGELFDIISPFTEVYRVNRDHVLSLKCRYSPETTTPDRGTIRLVWLEDHVLQEKIINMKDHPSIDAAQKCAKRFLEGVPKTELEEVVDIALDKYLAMSEEWKLCYGGYSVGVDFPITTSVQFYPRLLGMWLGYWYSDATMGDYIFSRFRGEMSLVGFSMESMRDEQQESPFLSFLRDQNLLGEKHIPQCCKTASRQDRLLLLAGLVDACGRYSKITNMYEMGFKKDTLRSDVLFLARSLGFKARNISFGSGDESYDFLEISGPGLETIPLLAESKRAGNSKEKPEHFFVDIKIAKAGLGKFYGFTLDGDGRYLHQDFTVTHNTTELLSRHRIQKISQDKRRGSPGILLVRYAKDNRYSSDGLATHDEYVEESAIPAEDLESVKEIAKDCSHIYIDEAQFFPRLKEYCVAWAKEGKHVHLACLDGYGNINHDPWPEVARVEPYARDIRKRNAVCFNCGEPAPLTRKICASEIATEEIGGMETYEAICLDCL